MAIYHYEWRFKAINRLERKHLKVSRQRKDFAIKTALCVVKSHVCGCGTVLDRDHNAALNILAKALRQAGIDLNTAGYAVFNAWGQNDRSAELTAEASTRWW